MHLRNEHMSCGCLFRGKKICYHDCSRRLQPSILMFVC